MEKLLLFFLRCFAASREISDSLVLKIPLNLAFRIFAFPLYGDTFYAPVPCHSRYNPSTSCV
jgi:hypothetical protein